MPCLTSVQLDDVSYTWLLLAVLLAWLSAFDTVLAFRKVNRAKVGKLWFLTLRRADTQYRDYCLTDK